MASKNVWYFAYGSNMNPKVLTSRRGIHPKRSIKAVGEGYRLTFDLPGLPYLEPSFANVAPINYDSKEGLDGNAQLENNFTTVRPVEGVAHYITEDEFKQIQYSEGGSGHHKIGYQPLNLKLDLEDGEQVEGITLHYANRNREFRPSKRYLNLLVDGSEQFKLTDSYQNYLQNLPSYQIDTRSQTFAKYVFITLLLPIVLPLFATSAIWSMRFKKQPPYFLAVIQFYINRSIWYLHDEIFAIWFGKGC